MHFFSCSRSRMLNGLCWHFFSLFSFYTLDFASARTPYGSRREMSFSTHTTRSLSVSTDKYVLPTYMYIETIIWHNIIYSVRRRVYTARFEFKINNASDIRKYNNIIPICSFSFADKRARTTVDDYALKTKHDNILYSSLYCIRCSIYGGVCVIGKKKNHDKFNQMPFILWPAMI